MRKYSHIIWNKLTISYNAYQSGYFEYKLYLHKISIVDPFATTPGDGSGKAKLATVAAALLKAKKSGQLPSAFGDIVLPGLDDEDTAGADGNLNSNNDTQPLPQRNENGIQGKTPIQNYLLHPKEEENNLEGNNHCGQFMSFIAI